MKADRRIIIAPDSFKGSISAKDAACAIESGLHKGLEVLSKKNITLPTLELITCPIADGGEGTLDALTQPQSRFSVSVTGTDTGPILAEYGWIGEVAVIEMARAAGLTLIPEKQRNAATATTYGVGELMKDALNRGFRKLLITVGGSGTNDGGCGMFAALGARFLDTSGSPFIPTGGTLDRIARIDLSELDPRLALCEITVATDVTNPLCGECGATAVYGRQKGADDLMLERMEYGMRHYEKLLNNLCGREIGTVSGCGAGGGFPAPLLAFCRASIRSGISAVLDAVGFDTLLSDADAVITGEGKLDRQSLYGKAISGVTEAAKAHGVPVICFVGCVADDPEELIRMGIRDIRTLSQIAQSSEDSIKNAEIYLHRLAFEFIKEEFDSGRL